MYRQKSIKRDSLGIPNVFKAVKKEKPLVGMTVPELPLVTGLMETTGTS